MPSTQQPDLTRLKQSLVVSGLQIKDNPLFQTIDGLISAVKQFQDITINDISSINNTVNNITNNGSLVTNYGAALMALGNDQPINNSPDPCVPGYSKLCPGGVDGSVQYNKAGNLFGDSNLFFDYTNGRLGIGTSTPQRALQVQADSAVALTAIATYNSNTTDGNGTDFSFRGVSTGTGANTFFEFATIELIVSKHDNATAQSTLSLYTRNAGSEIENLRATGNGITLPVGDLFSSVGHIYLSTQGINTQNWIYVDQTISTDITSRGYFSQIRCDTTSVANTNTLEGIHGKIFCSAGANNVANVFGVNGEVQRGGSSAGTLTIATGVQGYVHNDVAGVIATAYGFYSLVTTTTGTITNGYGIYLESAGSLRPTNSYGLYQVDSVSLNFFAGKLGLGQSTPTALLHIKAGAAAASSAPLKLTSGTSLTTAEAGAFEFTTDDLFFTITTGAARKGIILNNGSNLTSGKIPVATTNGRLVDSSVSSLLTGGVGSIVASTFEKAETGTDANVLTYTAGGTDEYLVVMVSADVSALTGTSIVITVTWKDSNNATATSSITLSGVADGTINVPINLKTATSVVVSTVFVGVSTAYNISAFITRLK